MQSNQLPPQRHFRVALGAGLLTFAAGLGGCGGGGDGDGGSSFQLLNVSGLPSGSATEWKINRPIHFNFTEPVEFSSVGSAAIQIRTSSGQQALGEFVHDPNVDPNRVTFQPRCPTEPDLSDAGLKIGEDYTILVLGGSSGGSLAIRSKDGDTLSSSQLRTFSTPDSTSPDVIFFDTEPTPPRVVTYPVPEDVMVPDSMAAALDLGVSFVEYGDGEIDVLEIVNGTVPKTVDRDGAGVPLNLYSGGDQSFSVLLEFDQPVNPSAANMNSDRLTIQFLDGASWVDLPTQVTLEENCTSRGARVRLDAIGIAPKDALLRVEVAAAFEDLVGQPNALPANEFARLQTGDGSNPIDLTAQPLVDEYLESFDSQDFLDEDAVLDLPRAEWGEGRLSASFDFPTMENLSPGFDWIIENGTVSVINTGATDTIQNDGPFMPGIDGSQTVDDGRIFVRDFIVQNNATVQFTGPNPVEIWATGDVVINGQVIVRGFDAENQDSLQSANAVPGAIGAAGGGTGGTASPSNLLVPDEKGGDGFGPFNLPGFGGKGGESGYGPAQPVNRRAGGGGGGRLITDFTGFQGNIDGANPTPGNDGTPINPDNPNIGAFSAVDGGSPPKGGATGDSILQNEVVLDNFWGVRRLGNGTILEGELPMPSPGSGGGGGGDSIGVNTFPGNFQQNQNLRGAGGAGGGGLIRISCLGSFTVGVNGLIDVGGGIGARGERKISDNRGVAGGSGGGSAGMIVLESSVGFDLSGPGNANPPRVCFNALGGLGGPGKDGNGNAYGSDNSGEAGGGNGGGGIIQLHVFDDESIPGDELVDLGSANLPDLGLPNPAVIFPTFGARSRAVSQAIPLGGATQDLSSLPQPTSNLRYGFSGLPGANGDLIPATGETVNEESPLYSGGAGTIVSIDDTSETVVVTIPQATADDVDLNRQLRNPQLLIGYELELQNGVAGQNGFTVAAADFSYRVDDTDLTSALALELELVLEGTPDLSDYVGVPNIWRLRPRFYRVTSTDVDGEDAMPDRLPNSSEVSIEWQGLGVNSNGSPDFNSPIVDWTADPASTSGGFNDPTLAETIEFFRYRVTFNNDAENDGLTGDEELPTLEFLRLIFEF